MGLILVGDEVETRSALLALAGRVIAAFVADGALSDFPSVPANGELTINANEAAATPKKPYGKSGFGLSNKT